jgi:ATP-dependent Clp protease ATP-binding subunit ClpC
MYERFTDRARKVMQFANQEAQRFRHEYIGTEHVLLGIVTEGSGVAANVLKNLDIDLHKIRLEIEKIPQADPGDEIRVTGRLPQTPRVKKVIEYAIEGARTLNHNYVGTEHLLLGLLRDDRGVAGQVLMNFGLKLETVREEVQNLLGRNLPTPPVGPLSDSLTGDTSPPYLTADQLRRVEKRVRRLNAQAARCHEEAEALKHLLAWYEWSQRPR